MEYKEIKVNCPEKDGKSVRDKEKKTNKKVLIDQQVKK